MPGLSAIFRPWRAKPSGEGMERTAPAALFFLFRLMRVFMLIRLLYR